MAAYVFSMRKYYLAAHFVAAHFLKQNASGYLLYKEGKMVYFIACITTDENKDVSLYEEYIREVQPIVECFGGKYVVRSNQIMGG